MLRAFTSRSYSHLAIQDGGTASIEYLRVTHGDVAEDERQRTRQHLEQYCGLDTEGMICIVDALRRLAAKGAPARALSGCAGASNVA